MSQSIAQVVTLMVLGLTSLAIGIRYGRISAAPTAIARKLSTASEREDESSSDEYNLGLAAVKAGALEQCKLVLCVRTDLKMTPGKIASQCGHATLACYKALSKANPALVRHWEITGQAKVALKCPSEEELLLLQAKAQSLNLCAKTIMDAGRTEVDPGTITVLGIGPAPIDLINQVTGKLRLL